MKKYIVNFTAAALALAFTGCSDVWTGGSLDASTSSFAEAENTAAASTGSSTSGHETANYAVLSLGGTDYYTGQSSEPLAFISKAGADSEIVLVVKSYSRLDEKSISDAIKFTRLSDGSCRSGAPVRGTALGHTVADVTSTADVSAAGVRNVTTVIEFKVDTSSVEEKAIALFADASLLRDVHGQPVLNSNLNERCGEETDSLVRYIGIEKKSDGTTPFVLSFTVGEDFAPDISCSTVFEMTSMSVDEEGKLTVMSGASDYADYSVDPIEFKSNSGLASRMNEMFSLQVRGKDSLEWNASSLTFTYDDSNHRYVSQAVTTEPGARYRLVRKVPSMNNGICDTNPAFFYGHDGYQSYTDSYTEFKGGVITGTYYSAEPSYIVTTGSFNAGSYSYEVVTEAQASLFSVTEKDAGKFVLDLVELADEQLEFDVQHWSDFIVTDDEYNSIPCTVTLKDKDSVFVELENRFYTGAVNVWAGEGTAIASNPVTGNSQRSFGIYKDSDYRDAAGYVKIH